MNDWRQLAQDAPSLQASTAGCMSAMSRWTSSLRRLTAGVSSKGRDCGSSWSLNNFPAPLVSYDEATLADTSDRSPGVSYARPLKAHNFAGSSSRASQLSPYDIGQWLSSADVNHSQLTDDRAVPTVPGFPLAGLSPSLYTGASMGRLGLADDEPDVAYLRISRLMDVARCFPALSVSFRAASSSRCWYSRIVSC